jgi:hypothetical protein
LLGAATVQGAIADADVTAQLEQRFFAPARASYGKRRWNEAHFRRPDRATPRTKPRNDGKPRRWARLARRFCAGDECAQLDMLGEPFGIQLGGLD